MRDKYMAAARTLRLKLRKQLMPYRIWPDMMPWVDETIAAALTAARQEQAEADAKLLESRVERCYELAAGSLTGEAKMAWMAEGAQLQAAADAIRDRARTTGGE